MDAVPGDAAVGIIIFPGVVAAEIIIIPAAAEMTGQTATTVAAMLQALTQVMRPVSEMASGQAIITM